MKKIIALLVIPSLVCGFLLGFGIAEETIEPTIKYVRVVIPYPEIVYREVVKETEVIREVEVEIPSEFREFESLEKLEAWLAENELPIKLVANERGIIYFEAEYGNTITCVNYALDLQELAWRDGYLMSLQIVGRGKLGGKRLPIGIGTGWHLGNLVIIKDKIYYVESLPPHKVTFIMMAKI